MDKEVAKIIKEQTKKEREETKKRHATNSHNVVDRIAQRLIEKQYKVDFNRTWSTIAIIKAGNRFHQNFQASFRAHPLRYKGINLGVSIVAQSESKAKAKARMFIKGHVLARLLQHSID
jgi:hypothetical protein